MFLIERHQNYLSLAIDFSGLDRAMGVYSSSDSSESNSVVSTLGSFDFGLSFGNGANSTSIK